MDPREIVDSASHGKRGPRGWRKWLRQAKAPANETPPSPESAWIEDYVQRRAIWEAIDFGTGIITSDYSDRQLAAEAIYRGIISTRMTPNLAASPLVWSCMRDVETRRGENTLDDDGKPDGLTAEINVATQGRYFSDAENLLRYRQDLGDWVILKALSEFNEALKEIDSNMTPEEQAAAENQVLELKRLFDILNRPYRNPKYSKSIQEILNDARLSDRYTLTIAGLHENDIDSLKVLGRKAIIHHRQDLPNIVEPDIDISKRRASFERLCQVYTSAMEGGEAYLTFARGMSAGQGMQGITPQDEANAHAYIEDICNGLSDYSD